MGVEARYVFVGRQTCQAGNGLDPSILQLDALRMLNVGNKAQMVVLLPLGRTPRMPAAIQTVRAGIGIRIGGWAVGKKFESSSRVSDIVRKVLDAEADPPAVAEHEMHFDRRHSLYVREKVGIDAQLNDVLRVGVAGQFGIGDLVAVIAKIRRL